MKNNTDMDDSSRQGEQSEASTLDRALPNETSEVEGEPAGVTSAFMETRLATLVRMGPHLSTPLDTNDTYVLQFPQIEGGSPPESSRCSDRLGPFVIDVAREQPLPILPELPPSTSVLEQDQEPLASIIHPRQRNDNVTSYCRWSLNILWVMGLTTMCERFFAHQENTEDHVNALGIIIGLSIALSVSCCADRMAVQPLAEFFVECFTEGLPNVASEISSFCCKR